ncbi:MAG: hypothetical protein ACW980_24035 [Promethearchaeota archaeon]|jgi:hypothetical protein
MKCPECHHNHVFYLANVAFCDRCWCQFFSTTKKVITNGFDLRVCSDDFFYIYEEIDKDESNECRE